MHYILKDKKPVLVDLMTWARQFDDANRIVEKTDIGTVFISTVFLGLDHNYGDEGPPILFETLVFGGALDGEMDRYATWDEAVVGHKEMVARVETTQKEEQGNGST